MRWIPTRPELLTRPALACALVLLVACSGSPKRDAAAPVARAPAGGTGSGAVAPLPGTGDDPCAVIYEHNEADYTPGGLYRPGQRDHAPSGIPDISTIPEPVPRREPLARYGNRPTYTVLGRNYHVLEDATGFSERGIASWYGAKFHGRPTSSMEPYDMCAFTAAHKTLPLPSYARVTNLDNGRSIIVRVNDRGPFHDGRVIDLSYVAALKLGIYARGIGNVQVDALAEGMPIRDAGTPGTAVASAPSATPAAAFSPGWLQVGSFGERANARAAEQRLHAAGIRNVDTRRTRGGDRTLWRVRVGPVSSAGEADELRQRIGGLGLGQPQLVRE